VELLVRVASEAKTMAVVMLEVSQYDTLHRFPDGLAPGALLDHAVQEGVLKDSGRLLRYL